MLGVMLTSLGTIAACSSTGNVAKLFGIVKPIVGVGNSLVYTITNALPVQYFSGKSDWPTGLSSSREVLGGTIMAVALEALIRRVGIEWTLRIQGIMTIAIGLPAAWFMKDWMPAKKIPFAELRMFRNL